MRISDVNEHTDSVFPAPLEKYVKNNVPRRPLLVTDVPFTRNDDGLPLALFAHPRVRIFGDSKQVRFQFSLPSPAVRLNDFRLVERYPLERIDCNQYYATVCVDAMLRVAIADGMKN